MDLRVGDGLRTELRIGDRPAVVAIGEADSFSTAVLARALDDALQIGPKPITLDVSRVTFMDGSALAVIATAAATHPGRPLEVRGADAFTTRLFHLVGMEHLLAA